MVMQPHKTLDAATRQESDYSLSYHRGFFPQVLNCFGIEGISDTNSCSTTYENV